MHEIIMKALQLALGGSITLLVVMALRGMFKKIPKKFICFLWMVALIRLCMPVLPQGPVPAFWRVPAETKEAAEDGQQYMPEKGSYSVRVESIEKNGKPTWTEAFVMAESIGNTENIAITEYIANDGDVIWKEDTAKVENAEVKTPFGAIRNAVAAIDIVRVLGVVWIVGIFCAMGYLLVSYLRFAKTLKDAHPIHSFKGYAVKEHSVAGLPAVFGLFRPVIYVPTSFEEWGDANQREMILLHEITHIKRRDNILKLFSMVVLCLYWWNPLVWLSVGFLNNDIEMACDEGVLAEGGSERKEAYAKVLLHYAVQRSGMVLPVGFGESNTEGRIKNIIGYKKTTVWVSGLLILGVGIITIFMMTRPRDVMANETQANEKEAVVFSSESDEQENENAENVVIAETNGESIKNDDPEKLAKAGKHVGSKADWQHACREYWGDRLLEEGKISNLERDLFFYAPENLPEESDEFTHYKAVAVAENGEIFIYDSKCLPTADEYDFSETMHTELGAMVSKEDLQNNPVFLFNGWLEDIEGESLWVNLVPVSAERLERANGNPDVDLKDSVKAGEFFLRLQGGKGEFIQGSISNGYLKYTFANGDSEFIEMCKYEEIWYPDCICGFVEEYREPYLKDLIEANEYLAGVDVNALKNVKESVEGRGVLEKEYELMNHYVILSRAKEADAVLYGMYGGMAMVLRVKDQVVPILLNWFSPQMQIPEIYAGDYDGDGQEEYALKTHFKTGTGISGDQLYIIELTNDSYEIFEYTEDMRQDQWDTTCDFDETNKLLTVQAENGKEVVLDLTDSFKEREADGETPELQAVRYGDYESFSIEGDNIYYEVMAYPLITPQEWFYYGDSLSLDYVVSYNENGFDLNNIDIKINNGE